MRSAFRLSLTLLLTISISAASDAIADNNVSNSSVVHWPSFQNGGVCQISEAIPTAWSTDSNLKWTADIEGYGQSTPLVINEQVVVTSTSGANKEQCHVTAFDLKSGQQVWQQTYTNPTPEKNSTYVSRAAPSPAADAAGIYCFFEGGLVVGLDLKGELKWSRDLVADYGPIEARHGLASSVEQDTDNVFVWIERGEDPYILALNKNTGETAWKTAGVGSTTWSSPRLVSADANSKHLICSASGKVIGVDATDGKRLWELSDVSNNTSCTPCELAPGRFILGASEGRGEENSGKAAASNGLIALTKQSNGQWEAAFQWRAKKATSSFGSPIATKDKTFFVNRVGVLYSLDSETGKAGSPKRLASGSTWATPLVAGGKLYVFGQKGTTSIVDLKTMKEVASNTLWKTSNSEGPAAFGGSVLYAAAVAGDQLILRRGDKLYAIAAGTE